MAGDILRNGYAMTVLGPVAPEALGPTLLHEHLLCDLRPLDQRGSPEPEVEITLANAFAVNYRPGAFRGNHRVQDVGLAGREAAAFVRAGGGAIVDVTTGGLAPDPEGLAAVSRASGVHAVLGAGWYTAPYLDADTLALDEGALEDGLLAQLTDGAWGTPIRCGLIGEIGCSWPLHPFERRCLHAAARVQGRTGAALTVHPGRDPAAPFEILRIVDAAGGDLSRTIIDHMDRTYFDEGEIVPLARTGCVVEFDFFCIETSNYWLGVADLPTDWMRLRAIRRLFEAGLGEQVAVSHDICTRSRLRANGGHGYAHLLENVVPLMRERGFSADEVDQLLVRTPRRLLTLPGRRQLTADSA
ncbi:MAG: hypothetical protein JO048_13355 [Methylobacteriaceae bacterium]|nr:hypothetical protein [Methylobacteriaceae bacterium]